MGPALDERRRSTAPAKPRVEEPARDRALTPAGVLQMQREHGNQAVQRMVRATSSRPVLARNKCVVQAAYMSGDMFGIAAALTLDPTLRVLILQEDDDGFKGVREEQSALYMSFYETALKQAGVTEEVIAARVKRVKVKDTQAVFKKITGDDGPGDQWPTLRFAASDEPRSPGYATTVVGDRYQARPGDSQAAVRNAFTGAAKGPSDEKLAEFVTRKGFVTGKKYALLWIRFSAKEKSGGAHPELDTSVQGVRQIKEMLKHTGRTPVLVGDRPGKDITPGTIDMIKFWDEEPFKEFKGLDTRIAQLRMFEYMRKSGIDLLSVGMRSGAMEGPALLGIPTIYVEEIGNEQHERMEKWKGKVPGWSQLTVGSLPTRTGKRYQGLGNRNVPAMEKAVDDSVEDVGVQLDLNWGEANTALNRSYNTDWLTFRKSMTRGRGQLQKAAITALSNWHRNYTAHKLVLDRLYAREGDVTGASGKDGGSVFKALRAEGASDINTGLADYVRIVLPSLLPPLATEEKKKEIAGTVRKWRAVWVGKDELPKGFAPEDLKALFNTPQMRADRFALIIEKHGDLLLAIDDLMGEPRGSAQKRLPGLQETATAGVFVNAYVEAASIAVKDKLKLPWRWGMPAAEIRVNAQNYAKTPQGATWGSAMFQNVSKLHGLLFPKLS